MQFIVGDLRLYLPARNKPIGQTWRGPLETIAKFTVHSMNKSMLISKPCTPYEKLISAHYSDRENARLISTSSYCRLRGE